MRKFIYALLIVLIFIVLYGIDIFGLLGFGPH